MRRDKIIFRAIAIPLITCLLQMFLWCPAFAYDCSYDTTNPTVDNARISFRSLNYDCAEKEILEFLNLESLTIEQKADAHVLLAAVYYAKLKNDTEKKSRVIEQFKEAFKAYRDWRGELDIRSTEFFEMMNEAQVMVDQEAEQAEAIAAEKAQVEPEQAEVITAEKPPVEPEQAVVAEEIEEEDDDDVAAIIETSETGGKSKPWYTKWWAIGLGVGVVAAVVVAASGGGGDDDGGGGDAALPDFPDPPATK